jgi:hypothetical protein
MTIERPRLGDGVLYVGMNSTYGQCDAEARALRGNGPGKREAVGHGEKDIGADHARMPSGTVVDLGEADEAREFAAALGLPAEQSDRIAEILVHATPGSRDELAQIASVFARAERGGDIPSRWVFSGHSTGQGIYDGDGRYGALQFNDVFALADAMPRAASQVEDIMLSACSSGFHALTDWREHFPNLKTAWGYGGQTDFHSPTGATAIEHIKAWESATRGRREELHPRADIVHSHGSTVGYENNVSVWTVNQGYVQGR